MCSTRFLSVLWRLGLPSTRSRRRVSTCCIRIPYASSFGQPDPVRCQPSLRPFLRMSIASLGEQSKVTPSMQSFDELQPTTASRARLRNHQQPSFFSRPCHQDWRGTLGNWPPCYCHLPRNLRRERGNCRGCRHFHPLCLHLSGMLGGGVLPNIFDVLVGNPRTVQELGKRSH